MNQVITALRKIDKFLGGVSKVIVAVSIAAQTIIMFLGVIFRYFLKSPLTWSDESATFLMIFITFFGCYVALQGKLLAKIEFIVDSMPKAVRAAAVLAANLMVLALLGAIAYYGLVLSLSPVVLIQKTSAMELPMIWFYMVVPVTALFMIVHMLIQTYDTWQGREGIR